MTDRSEIQVQAVPAREVAASLRDDRVSNLFALFLTEHAPDAPANLARSGEQVLGSVVGLAWVPIALGAWLTATTPTVARALLAQSQAELASLSLGFPLGLTDVVADALGHRCSVDQYFVFDGAPTSRPPVHQELDAALASSLRIASDVAERIGRIDTLPRPFYVLVEDQEVVATVDAAVRTSGVCTLQQLYVRPALRGSGRAARLVQSVTNELRAQNLVVTALASASNTASCTVAQRCGFRLHAERGWADPVLAP